MRRILNIFRRRKIDRSFDEELQTHIDEAIASGRNPEEVRRAIGSPLRHREESRSIRVAPWLDSLTSDVVFGLRQLRKNRITSAVAILSLALAIGACTGAFRLLDAVLFRPLPIAHPERLYVAVYQFLDSDGKRQDSDGFSYPLYREMRDAVKNDAQILALSRTMHTDITYAGDEEIEKANLQYVSAETLPSFGLRPAIGRLLCAEDHRHAVLSYNYWSSRFGRDPTIVGKSFRFGNERLEIVGVLEEGFTGIEPGTITGIFVPTSLNGDSLSNRMWGWIRILVHTKSDAPPSVIRERMQIAFSADLRERTKNFPVDYPRARLEEFVNSPFRLDKASSGASRIQTDYQTSLLVLAGV